MAKRKIGEQEREMLMSFLKKQSKAIINAELKTYRDVEVSEHTPRLYIFTNFTMGLATFSHGSEDNIARTIRQAVAQFKREEPEKIKGSEHANLINMIGSNLTALIIFLPSRMLKIDISDKSSDPQELIEMAKIHKLTPEKVIDDKELFAKYGKYVHDVISIQYTSFYENKCYIYKVVAHNDEVLDMPLIEEIDYGKLKKGIDYQGDILNLGDLIEIE